MSERWQTSKVAWILLACGMLGCSAKPNQPTATQVKSQASEPQQMTQLEFDMRVTPLANRATARVYQCMTEMYSLKYHPVSSGPVCRDACELYKTLNDFEEAHLDLNANVGDGKLTGMPTFCSRGKAPSKKGKP